MLRYPHYLVSGLCICELSPQANIAIHSPSVEADLFNHGQQDDDGFLVQQGTVCGPRSPHRLAPARADACSAFGQIEPPGPEPEPARLAANKTFFSLGVGSIATTTASDMGTYMHCRPPHPIGGN